MNTPTSYFYDFLILAGLASFGAGLFLLWGDGAMALGMGITITLTGILGHYRLGK